MLCSALKPWAVDLLAYRKANKADKELREQYLFFNSGVADLFDVLQYGFPPSPTEVHVRGNVCFEGGLLFTEVLPEGVSSVLVCKVPCCSFFFFFSPHLSCRCLWDRVCTRLVREKSW